jgi:sigma-54 dependent transcriptional regulator, acetoin dehydrogenase operon transcriptional activator AcoR
MPQPRKIEKGATLKTYMRTAEKCAIEHALAEAKQNKTITAEILGIHRTLLYRKMQQLGMLGQSRDDH